MPSNRFARHRRNRTRLFAAALLLLTSAVTTSAQVITAAAAATPLYPDLKVLPPRDLRFATVNVSSDPNASKTSRVLQFSNTQLNAGEGQLDLRATIDQSLNPPSGPAVQKIYDSAGGSSDITVGSMYYHSVHQHYHYEGWGKYELWTKANWDAYVASNRSTTPNPMLGTKTTSCVLDEEFVQKLANTPYPGPNTGSGCQLDSSGSLHEGLSPGWGDTYDWYRFEQWVDLGSSNATLPDGSYVLRSVADPDNQIYESPSKANSTRESQAANEATTAMVVSGGQIVDTQSPTGSIAVNGVQSSTNSSTVKVDAVGRDDVSGVNAFRLSNDNAHWSQVSYTTSGSVPTTVSKWSLTDPAYGGVSGGGPKTVYAQFHDVSGKWGPSTSATINLNQPTPASGPYATAVMGNSPAAYWRLGEKSGTSVADATGANPGSYASGVTLGRPSLVPAQTDTAVGVGPSGAATIPNSSGLSPARLSVETWFKPDALPAAGQFASLVTKGESYSLQLNGPRLEFTLIDSAGARGRLQAPAGAVAAGQTYHVVGTWDGATQRLYVNGTQVAAVARTASYRTTGDPLRLGSWDGTSEFLKGTLDEVAVYPTALTAAQVQSHRNAGTTTASSQAAARTAPQATPAPAPTPVTTAARYPLSVSRAGNGAGTVRSTDGAIDCPGTCAADYPSDARVTLTATPATGSVFAGWSGACGGTSPSCVVSTYAATSATATFSTRSTPATLTVTRAGSGTVTSNPSGVRCGMTCSMTVPVGTSVTLTATPASGSTFSSWAGACSGARSTCTLVVTRDTDLSATFRP